MLATLRGADAGPRGSEFAGETPAVQIVAERGPRERLGLADYPGVLDLEQGGQVAAAARGAGGEARARHPSTGSARGGSRSRQKRQRPCPPRQTGPQRFF